MSGGSTALLFLRMGLSLGIILALIWGAARVVRRKGVVAPMGGTTMQVVGRRSVGRRSSLLVVNAAGRTLLVGCTDTQVSLVADLTDGVAAAADAPEALEAPAAKRVELDLVDDEDGTGGGRVVRLPQRSAPAGERSTLLDSIRDLTVRRI